MGTLRFLLAMAVALGHGGGAFGYFMMNGARAVQCFYVISGFLITHILLTKYDDKPRGTWLFYSNRALRIFIPYWTVLLATAAVSVLIYAITDQKSAGSFDPWLKYGNNLDLPSRVFLIFTNIFIVGQDLCLWLVRDGTSLRFEMNALVPPFEVHGLNVVTPAWTLAVELMFYACAPFLVRRSVATISAIIIVATIAKFTAFHYGYNTSATAYRFFPFEIAMFLMGALSYRLYQFVDSRGLLIFRNSVIVTIAFTVLVLTLQWTGIFTSQYRLNIVAMILLPSLFHFSSKMKWDRWIGELSYPIYLIHFPVMVAAYALVTPSVWTTPINISITLLLSVILVRYICEPLDKWRALRVSSKSQPAMIATPSIAL